MKKAGIAALLSAVFPGLGQWYNRQWLKGTFFLAAAILAIGWTWTSIPPLDSVLHSLESGEPITGLGDVILSLLVLLAIVLWSIIDAWRSSRLP